MQIDLPLRNLFMYNHYYDYDNYYQPLSTKFSKLQSLLIPGLLTSLGSPSPSIASTLRFRRCPNFEPLLFCRASADGPRFICWTRFPDQLLCPWARLARLSFSYENFISPPARSPSEFVFFTTWHERQLNVMPVKCRFYEKQSLIRVYNFLARKALLEINYILGFGYLISFEFKKKHGREREIIIKRGWIFLKCKYLYYIYAIIWSRVVLLCFVFLAIFLIIKIVAVDFTIRKLRLTILIWDLDSFIPTNS